jgi:hypothetical protein
MRWIVCLLVTMAITMASIPIVLLDGALSKAEARKDTCWRTNRATHQRFRIC